MSTEETQPPLCYMQTLHYLGTYQPRMEKVIGGKKRVSCRNGILGETFRKKLTRRRLEFPIKNAVWT